MQKTKKRFTLSQFDWSKTEQLKLFSDVDDLIQLHTFSPLSSIGLSQLEQPQGSSFPLFSIYDAFNPLSSSLDYEEMLQYSDASSSKCLIKQKHFDEFDDDKADNFRDIILNTKFEPGEDNEATLLFEELMANEKTKDAVLKFIQGLFIEMYKEGNVAVCVKILTMLGSYSYGELFPFSQAIALASISYKNSRVISAAINLFAHWGNKEALDLLNNVQKPKEPWIKMKYLSVKKSLEEKCYTQER